MIDNTLGKLVYLHEKWAHHLLLVLVFILSLANWAKCFVRIWQRGSIGSLTHRARNTADVTSPSLSYLVSILTATLTIKEYSYTVT